MVLLAKFSRRPLHPGVSVGNEQATVLSGVPVLTHKTLAYVLSGLGAAIGGLLITAKFGTANTGAGNRGRA